jgi:uncharacterized membrane protein YagU involved in acid resistance
MLDFINGLDSRVLLIVFLVVLDIWCMLLLWRSSATGREKWLWTGVILLCPIVGCLFWYVLGPKQDLLSRE